MSLDQPEFRKHRILILETKLEILKKLSKGESGASLAKQYGVSKSTVSEIKRKGDTLLQYASTIKAEDGLKRRKTLRMASNTALEEEVYKWFTERRSSGEPVSGPLICEKALEMNENMGGPSDFKASSGWLKNFKTRHNIKMQDLIIADFTARVANNSANALKEKDEERKKCQDNQQKCDNMGNSACETQSTNSTVNGCLKIIKSDRTCTSEVNSQSVSESSNSRTLQTNTSEDFKDVDKGYTVSFPTVTTILHQPGQENSEDGEDTSAEANQNNSGHLNVKIEKADGSDEEAEEDPTGPSDNDALIALDTAIDWLQRQPDRKNTHLPTLLKIRDFAIYKERLRSLTRGPHAQNS